MSTILLTTEIVAPLQTCFDLARSIDLHLSSMQHTKERAIAGRTSGLCELNDTIMWEAVHFGIKQNLTVKISKMESPHYFEDVMVKGAFKSIRHQHTFEENNGVTSMKDIFEYETPYGIFGKLFDALVLKKYMTNLLLERNRVIKQVSESA